MTQFLLAKSVNPSAIPNWIGLALATDDEFLSAIGAQIFAARSVGDVVTVVVDNEDFDSFFVKAQREVSAGATYEQTKLYDLLIALASSAQSVALWYGADYQDLNVADSPTAFAQLVGEGLNSPSIEAYVMYRRTEHFSNV